MCWRRLYDGSGRGKRGGFIGTWIGAGAGGSTRGAGTGVASRRRWRRAERIGAGVVGGTHLGWWQRDYKLRRNGDGIRAFDGVDHGVGHDDDRNALWLIERRGVRRIGRRNEHHGRIASRLDFGDSNSRVCADSADGIDGFADRIKHGLGLVGCSRGRRWCDSHRLQRHVATSDVVGRRMGAGIGRASPHGDALRWHNHLHGFGLREDGGVLHVRGSRDQ